METPHRLSQGTEFCGLNGASPQLTENAVTGWWEPRSPGSCSRPALALPPGQALLTRSVSNYCWAGPWLPSAESQFRARLKGKFIRIDLDKENLASVALRVHIAALKSNFHLKISNHNLQKGVMSVGFIHMLRLEKLRNNLRFVAYMP